MTESTGDPWEDEGFGGENDWAGESVESDLEEDDPLDAGEVDRDDELEEDELDDDDEQ